MNNGIVYNSAITYELFDTISYERIFKCLFNNATIDFTSVEHIVIERSHFDVEVRALLFASYKCFFLTLVSQLSLFICM